MSENLVIVESPAKAKTIQKFLGKDYTVMSSFGHIRDLSDKGLGIDFEHDYEPIYEVSKDKQKVVAELKKAAKSADMVWLASDEDREGEAISWHLANVLKLNKDKSKRIVFHEITKPAILKAIETPRDIDVNLVDAQQARRVLDRIVGYELSPVLWRKIKPSLSAGRVQSVTVRLIVEREREINNFKPEASYRITGDFTYTDENGKKNKIKAELQNRFKTKEDAMIFLEKCKKAEFSIDNVTVKPGKKTPAPPFTTSTLQQEAARKLGFTVNQTMRVAQTLYEAGHITYMRTDSLNLSSLAINTAKDAITENYGDVYSKPRQFHTHSKGAQEAHEAIRPTFIANKEINGTSQEKRLYDLIWKRTVASQMADAEIERTVATIGISTADEKFAATGEVIKFDGFLKVYLEGSDDESDKEDNTILPPLKKGDALKVGSITATERFTQHPARYTEASLVHKLEELGIGRPSTYAPIISTIQNRGYVDKEEKEGTERLYNVMSLNTKGDIKDEMKKEITGAEKGKLTPTDTGIVVTDFLDNVFPNIMDYNFTAKVEKDFDDIAEGKTDWKKSIDKFYKDFHPSVEASMVKSDHKVGERILGEEPGTGKPVSVKIGRFGPVAQIGSADEEEKPRFASLRKGQSIETITLDEALDLFKLPRNLGEFEDKVVTVAIGRFGPYIRHDAKFVSIPKTEDPMTITLETAIELIEKKRLDDKNKIIKTFDEEPELQILNGRFGPYISYKKSNYKIAKTQDPAALTLEECKAIIEKEDKSDKPKRGRFRRGSAAKPKK